MVASVTMIASIAAAMASGSTLREFLHDLRRDVLVLADVDQRRPHGLVGHHRGIGRAVEPAAERLIARDTSGERPPGLAPSPGWSPSRTSRMAAAAASARRRRSGCRR